MHSSTAGPRARRSWKAFVITVREPMRKASAGTSPDDLRMQWSARVAEIEFIWRFVWKVSRCFMHRNYALQHLILCHRVKYVGCWPKSLFLNSTTRTLLLLLIICLETSSPLPLATPKPPPHLDANGVASITASVRKENFDVGLWELGIMVVQQARDTPTKGFQQFGIPMLALAECNPQQFKGPQDKAGCGHLQIPLKDWCLGQSFKLKCWDSIGRWLFGRDPFHSMSSWKLLILMTHTLSDQAACCSENFEVPRIGADLDDKVPGRKN